MRELRSLSRREREIMDIVYRAGRATATEVRRKMAPAPSDSAVRTTLNILERKGLLKHELDGKRFVYRPTVPPNRARQGAIDHLIQTFFGGSTAGAVLALLERPKGKLSPEDLERMAERIERAREEGR